MGAFEANAACRIATPKKYINYNITLSPNPIKGQLSIQIDLENLTFECYDLLGKKVLSTSSKELNIVDFPQGVYILRIMNQEELIGTRKIIKE